MKAPLFLIAALMGTAAIAQTAPDPNAPASTPPTSATTPTAPTAAPPAAGMDATAPTAPAASSMDATAPAPTAPPTTSDTSLGVANNAQTATDTSNYPVCSRSVTDKCVQRGAAHKARRHH